MTEYQFHWWPSGRKQGLTSGIKVEAESHLHGAALALRHFVELGCNINTPLAHVDMSEPGGAKQTMLVEEVLDWLSDPKQTDFIRREGLGGLLQ